MTTNSSVIGKSSKLEDANVSSGMQHLALRNTKRGKGFGKRTQNPGFDIVDLVTIFYDILNCCCFWIKTTVFRVYLQIDTEERIEGPVVSEEEDEPVDDKPGNLVLASGVGLMAAYTGRRALFGVYPPRPEGLEVTSSGPAPLNFEFKKKDDVFLVSYIPPKAGYYKLRVSRFGKRAPGSPFVVRVEEPPPGYNRDFGAALWYDEPKPLPVLSGIVDFVTEKMFLTEDGRLVRLNRRGSVVEREEQIKTNYQRNDGTVKTEKDVVNKHIKEVNDILRTVPSRENLNCLSETRKSNTGKKQVLEKLDNLLSTLNRDTKKTSDQDYRSVSKALMKELSLSLKILNIISSSDESNPTTAENSPDAEMKKTFVIPEIRVTEDEARAGHRSDGKRFPSKEWCYGVRRTGKLGQKVARDDAGAGGPCDDKRHSGRREAISGRFWKKYGAWRKGEQPMTGVRLLHTVYRDESVNTKLNNSLVIKHNYQNNINIRNEKNYLEKKSMKASVRNFCSRELVEKQLDSFTFERKSTNLNRKVNQSIKRESSSSYRTLSLPDFNRILSLSVQGLRKAKSCGDRSFRAMSSSNLSLTIKNLFDRDQVYNVSGTSKSNVKPSNRKESATLVKMTYYGSEREKRNKGGIKSVDEWKKYWEEMAILNREKEYGKECSLEMTGIVHRGKAIFENTSNLEQKNRRTSVPKQEFPSNPYPIGSYLTATFEDQSETFCKPSPVSKKTAFEKAKEIFEGNYDFKDLFEQKEERRKSTSERFHVTSLTEDLQMGGVTPDLLGVPNRLSAVSCLGSVYHSQYPHPPITATRRRYSANDFDQLQSCDILLRSNPALV